MKCFIVLAALVAAVACLSIPSEQEIHEHWQKFKATHAKTYASATEEDFRMKIFKENVLKIAKHNDRFERGLVSFEVGVNKFADMHTHEVVEMLNGYRSGMRPAAARIHDTSEPAVGWPWPWPWNKNVDWRKKGYVTPVKDQGKCKAGWAFSAVGSMEGQNFKKTNKLVSLSEQNLVDCVTANDGCEGGSIAKAMEYVQANGGIDTEESYPSVAENGSCKFSKDNIAGTISGVVHVGASEEELKDAVKKIGPVSVAIDANNWSFVYYKSGFYYERDCSSVDLDHAVLAVGYDTGSDKKDFWIVKNSWGTDWGEQGYIKMARNLHNNCGIATEASYPTV